MRDLHHGAPRLVGDLGLNDLFPEYSDFRAEVAAFIAENYPAQLRVEDPGVELTKEQQLLWHRILHAKGWAAPHWPVEYGGTGWDFAQRYIFEQELAAADTLPLLAFSMNMVAPVIYTFGSEAQKQRFLPRILAG